MCKRASSWDRGDTCTEDLSHRILTSLHFVVARCQDTESTTVWASSLRQTNQPPLRIPRSTATTFTQPSSWLDTRSRYQILIVARMVPLNIPAQRVTREGRARASQTQLNIYPCLFHGKFSCLTSLSGESRVGSPRARLVKKNKHGENTPASRLIRGN